MKGEELFFMKSEFKKTKIVLLVYLGILLSFVVLSKIGIGGNCFWNKFLFFVFVTAPVFLLHLSFLPWKKIAQLKIDGFNSKTDKPLSKEVEDIFKDRAKMNSLTFRVIGFFLLIVFWGIAVLVLIKEGLNFFKC